MQFGVNYTVTIELAPHIRVNSIQIILPHRWEWDYIEYSDSDELQDIYSKFKHSIFEDITFFIYSKIEYIVVSAKKRDYTSYIGRSLSDLLVLGVLHDEPESLSGYLIIKKIRKISEGSIKLRAGTIYPRIEKLRKRGFLDQTDEADAARYSLNKQGLMKLQENAEKWYFLQDKINKILPDKEELL